MAFAALDATPETKGLNMRQDPRNETLEPLGEQKGYIFRDWYAEPTGDLDPENIFPYRVRPVGQ